MKYCNNCGNAATEDIKFCAKCGSKFGVTSPQNNTIVDSEVNNAEKNKEWVKKNKWIILGSIAGLSLLYFVYTNFISISPEKAANKLAEKNCGCYKTMHESLIKVKKEFLKNVKTTDAFMAKFKLDSSELAIRETSKKCGDELIRDFDKAQEKYSKAQDRAIFKSTFEAQLTNCADQPRELQKLNSEINETSYNNSSNSNIHDRDDFTSGKSYGTSSPKVEEAVAAPTTGYSSSSYGSANSSYSNGVTVYGNATPESAVKKYLNDLFSYNGGESVYNNHLYYCKDFYGLTNTNMSSVVTMLSEFKKNKSSFINNIKSVTAQKTGTGSDVSAVVDYYFMDNKSKKMVLKPNQTFIFKLSGSNTIESVSGASLE